MQGCIDFGKAPDLRQGEPDRIFHGISVQIDGFLTNRDSLPEFQKSRDDGDLVAQLFRARGLDGLTKLEGEFALAIWDQPNRQLVLMRDHFGRRPLYYHHSETRLAFSSDINKLIDLAGLERAPNLSHLAAMGMAPYSASRRSVTMFAGVTSLSPATIAVFSAKGLSLHPYWEPDSNRRLNHRDDDAFWDEFRALMINAVASRLPPDGPAVALLSGGLDSSTIVAIAARVLAEQGRELTTLSAVSAHQDDRLKSERNFIDVFADLPNIRQRHVAAPGCGPLDGYAKVIAHTHVPFISNRHFLYSAFADEMRQMGADRLLDGMFGEAGPSIHARAFFPEMLRRGRLGTVWHETRAFAQNNGRSHMRILGSRLLKPLWRIPKPPESGGLVRVFAPAFLNEFAPTQTEQIAQPGRWSQAEYQARVLRSKQKQSQTNGTFARHGLSQLAPFLDKKLAEFCLAAPTEMKFRDGWDRYMIRAGMQGLVPDAIRWRKTKAPFSVDLVLRYEGQRHLARDIFHSISPSDPVRQVVNIAAMQQLVEDDAVDRSIIHETARPDVHLVSISLYLIEFLRQFPEFRPS